MSDAEPDAEPNPEQQEEATSTASTNERNTSWAYVRDTLVDKISLAPPAPDVLEVKQASAPWGPPLRERQVRLFFIRPGIRDTFCIDLVTFDDRERVPPYTALSYHCGAAERDQVITLNGFDVPINRNLHAALQELEQAMQLHMKGTQFLWADALCINQSDEAEKIQQIRQLHHIYTHAKIVFASVGATSPLSNQFESMGLIYSWLSSSLTILMQRGSDINNYVQIIRSEMLGRIQTSKETDHLGCSQDNLASLLEQTFLGLWATVDPRRISKVKDRIAQVYTDRESLPINHQFWTDCLEFYDLEYFSRLWTYQEIRLSRAAYVSLGDRVVPWHTVAAMYVVVFALAMKFYAADRRLFIFSKSNMLAHSMFIFPPKSHINPLDLLEISLRRRATEGRDHILGLIALLDPPTRSSLELYASKPCAQLYEAALRFALGSSTARAILFLPHMWEACSRVSQKTPDIPSWCLDFHQEAMSQQTDSTYRILSRTVKRLILGFANLDFASGPGRIGIRVLMLNDTVSRVIREPNPQMTTINKLPRADKHDDVAVSKWFMALLAEVSSVDERVPEPLEKFIWREFRTVKKRLERSWERDQFQPKSASDRYHTTWQCAASSSFAYQAVKAVCRATANGVSVDWRIVLGGGKMSTVDDLLLVGREILTNNKEKVKLLLICWQTARAVRKQARYNCIFETTSGRCGFSPRLVAPGQRICVIPRGVFLHILTADKDRYVGFASVDGYMDDNLLDMLPTKEEMHELLQMGELFEMVTLH